VIVAEPTGNVEVVTLATPLANAGEPKTVEPAVIVTVPVALAGSVAVKVTAWPAVEGLAEDESVAAGDALATVCIVDPMAELLAASPPYVAVIVSGPTGRILVVIVTVPEEAVMVPLPSVTPPLVIVMVPVGPLGTDAVIETD